MPKNKARSDRTKRLAQERGVSRAEAARLHDEQRATSASAEADRFRAHEHYFAAIAADLAARGHQVLEVRTEPGESWGRLRTGMIRVDTLPTPQILAWEEGDAWTISNLIGGARGRVDYLPIPGYAMLPAPADVAHALAQFLEGQGRPAPDGPGAGWQPPAGYDPNPRDPAGRAGRDGHELNPALEASLAAYAPPAPKPPRPLLTMTLAPDGKLTLHKVPVEELSVFEDRIFPGGMELVPLPAGVNRLAYVGADSLDPASAAVPNIPAMVLLAALGADPVPAVRGTLLFTGPDDTDNDRPGTLSANVRDDLTDLVDAINDSISGPRAHTAAAIEAQIHHIALGYNPTERARDNQMVLGSWGRQIRDAVPQFPEDWKIYDPAAPFLAQLLLERGGQQTLSVFEDFGFQAAGVTLNRPDLFDLELGGVNLDLVDDALHDLGYTRAGDWLEWNLLKHTCRAVRRPNDAVGVLRRAGIAWQVVIDGHHTLDVPYVNADGTDHDEDVFRTMLRLAASAAGWTATEPAGDLGDGQELPLVRTRFGQKLDVIADRYAVGDVQQAAAHGNYLDAVSLELVVHGHEILEVRAEPGQTGGRPRAGMIRLAALPGAQVLAWEETDGWSVAESVGSARAPGLPLVGTAGQTVPVPEEVVAALADHLQERGLPAPEEEDAGIGWTPPAGYDPNPQPVPGPRFVPKNPGMELALLAYAPPA